MLIKELCERFCKQRENFLFMKWVPAKFTALSLPFYLMSKEPPSFNWEALLRNESRVVVNSSDPVNRSTQVDFYLLS
jgi:hypothetical protein